MTAALASQYSSSSELIVAESVEMLSTSSASPASDTRTYSPGPVLTPDDLRKMSLLSSLSVTIPLDEETFSVRAVSPTGCRLSPEHIIPQVIENCHYIRGTY